MAGVGILAPTAEPSSQGAPEQHYDLNQNMFGGGVAKAVGEASDQVYSQALKFKQMENETWANEATSNFARDLGDLQNQYRQLQGLNRTNALKEYQDKIQGLYQQYAKSAGSPAARLNFLTQGRGYADRTLESFGTLAGDAAEKAHDSAARGVIDTAKNAAAANYELADHSRDIDAVTNAASDYADQKGLTGADKLAYVQQQTGDVYESLAYAKLQVGDTAGARALLDHATESKLPGTDEPLLDRKNANRILHEVTAREQLEATRQETEDRRQEAAQRKAEADAGKAALDHYNSQLLKDPTSVDVNALANDPALGKWNPELKVTIFNELQRRLKGEGTSQDGPAFRDMLSRVVDPSNPNAITDIRDIYREVGPGGLTLPAANALDAVYTKLRNGDAKGDFEQANLTEFFKAQEKKITELAPGVKRPGGDDSYYKFWTEKHKAYEDGRKAGKTPQQLLTPDSPDYIGKDAQSFIPALNRGTFVKPNAAPPPPFRVSDLDHVIKSGPEGATEGMAVLGEAYRADPTPANAERFRNYAVQRGWGERRGIAKPIAPLMSAPNVTH